MVKLSVKGRKLIRKIFQSLGVTTAALLFQACYGPPVNPEIDVTINGKVVDAQDEPVPGVQVTVPQISDSVADLTDEDGVFYLFVNTQDSYTLQFEDIDGEQNGGSFQDQTKNISLADTYNPITIQLEENEE